jgi:hypothetical protein
MLKSHKSIKKNMFFVEEAAEGQRIYVGPVGPVGMAEQEGVSTHRATDHRRENSD